MLKRILAVVFINVLTIAFLTASAIAADEFITITTYYPSPYGSYNELQTNKLAVGDTDGKGSLDAADQPAANGQIYVARSVIFKPQKSLPALNAKEGELVYNDTDNKFYYYDGLSWKTFGEKTWSECIGRCFDHNNPSCPDSYTLVASNIGTGCSINYFNNPVPSPPLIGSWYVGENLGSHGYEYYETVETLYENSRKLCQSLCRTTGKTGGKGDLGSSQVICCK
ncbi:MAG: hypothetical protein QMD94_03780 [Candidatus Omnitrophota bacterium]|nr:hypothetical protein [Candidatus Omnitrophota bacterium]